MATTISAPQRSTIIDLLTTGHMSEAVQYVQSINGGDFEAAVATVDAIAEEAVKAPTIHPYDSTGDKPRD